MDGAEKKPDWKKERTELIKILDKYRTGSSNSDCVVLQLVVEKMDPMLLTY